MAQKGTRPLKPRRLTGEIEISEAIIISLGSNLGDSRENVRRGLERLREFSTLPVQSSSLWISAPLDCPPGSADFINAVALLKPLTHLTPETLLAALKQIEVEFGRPPKKLLNESRILDLDLIAFGKKVRNSPRLTLPHPRAHLRAFVLQPLAELASDYLLPGQSKTVRQLADSLPAQGRLTKLSS